MKHTILGAAVAVVCSAILVSAQTQSAPAAPAAAPAAQAAPRPASPTGSAATQVAGTWGKNARGTDVYQNGKWIEVTYSRPIMKGRDVWGSGADYGKLLLANGATVWRAGANVSTRLKTEVPLVMGGKTIPAGEYSLFIDTKSPTEWTLIVSNWAAQQKYDPNNKEALWGSFGYTADKDVARVPMTMAKLPASVDQLTWNFADVKNDAGKLAIMWDTVMASVPFTVGK